jgi:hypothetical protein
VIKFLAAALVRKLGRFPLMAELLMNDLSRPINDNIKRFQNLLETSVDDVERQTIQKLLSDEKANAGLPASEPQMK